ncbi:PiggyBac transposable element-derived protein 4 [Folsomia candida]|uniref:PiggyBac transposable element-derived protein 4 n=1 Tax=Folsomia candida TaxID=158441 RepID=A0A226DNU4_FOLCA|nr:PiggyBac transposable element-derived protein 4 [Folsomia candida]
MEDGESQDMFADFVDQLEYNIDCDRAEDCTAEGSEEETDSGEDEDMSSDDEDLVSPDDAIAEILTTAPTTQAVPWIWTPGSHHTPEVQDFDNLASGWAHLISNSDSELDLFLKMFDDDCREICLSETNKYADQTGNCRTKRWVKWTDVTDGELLKFIAVRMLMGINKKPEMKKFWSEDPLFHFPIIGQIMPQDRFFEIHKNLHFCDNTEYVAGNRLFKIQKIWDKVNANFKSFLIPHKNLSVDESLILFKGRLYFRQFIPSKRSRFGIKTYSIVDAETGFILFSYIYSGKNEDLPFSAKDYGYGGAIVLELAKHYLNKGHHIYCDNFFTSPNLAQFLLQNKTYLCGTLRKGRKNAAVPPQRMQRGQVEVFSSNGVLNEFWKDKKVVRMISTVHEHNMVDVEKRDGTIVQKPKSVVDYNKNARGIDQGDMQMHFNSTKRKTRKWYKKLFFQLIDMCLYNSFRVFKYLHGNAKFLDFQLQIIRQILDKFGLKKTIVQVPSRDLQRLGGRHFPEYNSSTKGKTHGSRKCHLCGMKDVTGGKRKETRFQCDTCLVPLCIIPCFKLYHTRKNL